MNLLGKLQNQYESLWKQIIRPPRAHYSQEALGPKQFNLELEEVQRFDFQLQDIQDNQFQGSVWVPSKRRGCPCVVYLHSSTGNRAEGMEYLGKLIKNGYSLCTFDFCGCGNADGNFITMGYYQQHQVNQVIDYLKQTLSIETFCLWGREMGAVSALQAMGKTIDVKACIADSPYKSLKSSVEEQLKKQFKVPSLLISGAVKMISKTIEDKAGFDIQNVNPCKFSVPGLHLPGLFIFVANEDGSITENDKKLFEAYAGKHKKYHLIPEKQSGVRKEVIVDSCLQFIAENLTNSPREKQSQKEFDFFEVGPNPTHREQSGVPVQLDRRQAQKEDQIKKQPKKGKEYSLKGIFSFFLPDSQPDQSVVHPKPNVVDLKDDYHQMRRQLSDVSSATPGKRAFSGHQRVPNKNTFVTVESKEGQQAASIDLNRWVFVQIQ